MHDKNTPEESYQEIEKLQEELSRLKEDIDHSYYRVPKEEFEHITVNKIASEVIDQVNKKINYIRNWMAILVLILSFFGISQWISLTKEIQKDVNEKASVIAKQEIERQLKTIIDDIKFAQKNAIETEFNTLRSDIKNKSISYAKALEKSNILLPKILGLNDKRLTNDFFDEHFRLTFNTYAYEKMDELRIKYENDFDFKESTWANIAIADMFLYEESHSPIYKERATSASHQALQRAPTYGIPHSVMLIIHMIDLEREKAQEKRIHEKEEAQKLINIVISGSRSVTAYEAYNYLYKLKKDKSVGKHINMLFDNFPDSMEKMRLKYEEYLALKK